MWGVSESELVFYLYLLRLTSYCLVGWWSSTRAHTAPVKQYIVSEQPAQLPSTDALQEDWHQFEFPF